MAYTLPILVQILEQDQRHLCVDSTPQIESLLEGARCLMGHLERHADIPVELDNHIRDAVSHAEDIVECHMTHIINQTDSAFKDESKLDLKVPLEEFDSIRAELLKQEPTYASSTQEPDPSANYTSLEEESEARRTMFWPVLPVSSSSESASCEGTMTNLYRQVIYEYIKKGIQTCLLFMTSVKIRLRGMLFRVGEFFLSQVATTRPIHHYDHVNRRIAATAEPNHDPCFLYLAAFPNDYVIRASKIIRLWIAEGFISPSLDNSLEDTADAYLKKLIESNNLLVCEEEVDGRVKAFKVLELESLRKKALAEKLISFIDLKDHDVPEEKAVARRFSIHKFVQPSDNIKLSSHGRSFLCMGRPSLRLAPLFLGLVLLRVLDVFELEFFHFPTEITKLIHLRYLSFSCHSDLPSSISHLKTLQTLIIRRLPSHKAFSLPSELWGLTQLRHVICKETCIWLFTDNGICVRHENLQTLSTIQMHPVTTSKLLHNIPNLKKLGLFCNTAMHNSVISLDCLSKLEKLKCSSNFSWGTQNFLSNLTFPSSLRKLTLSNCMIPLEFMATVSSMPSLAQLKLKKCDFLEAGGMDETWEPTWEMKGGFLCLISLHMEDLNLVHWKAKGNNFPLLKHLLVRGCSSLNEIPLHGGAVLSLEVLEVDDCCARSVIDSAKRILAEHISTGRDVLKVRDTPTGNGWSTEYEILRSLNKQHVGQTQDTEVKRKSYMKKLKEKMNIGKI